MNTASLTHLNGLEPLLASRIKGQLHVIPRVCSVLERGQLGLNPEAKPLGSFLFLGPTGVGKTQTALELSRYLFGEQALFRFDMSEFLHGDSVKLFTGDERGGEGRLGKVLAKHHEGVLLFDEIEKAHWSIWDLFLQMLDAARITLANQQTYDLSRFYLICTSNIGSQDLLRPTRLPFATLERAVLSKLHQVFRPELIGRFDEKIVFKPLSSETQREIALAIVSDELERLAGRGFQLAISDDALEFLIRRGMHRSLGARPMLKTVQKFIGDAIGEALKTEEPASGILTAPPGSERLKIAGRKGEASSPGTVIPILPDDSRPGSMMHCKAMRNFTANAASSYCCFIDSFPHELSHYPPPSKFFPLF